MSSQSSAAAAKEEAAGGAALSVRRSLDGVFPDGVSVDFGGLAPVDASMRRRGDRSTPRSEPSAVTMSLSTADAVLDLRWSFSLDDS